MKADFSSRSGPPSAALRRSVHCAVRAAPTIGTIAGQRRDLKKQQQSKVVVGKGDDGISANCGMQDNAGSCAATCTIAARLVVFGKSLRGVDAGLRPESVCCVVGMIPPRTGRNRRVQASVSQCWIDRRYRRRSLGFKRLGESCSRGEKRERVWAGRVVARTKTEF